MPRRAFEPAFSSSISGGLLVTANGSNAPQPEVQLRTATATMAKRSFESAFSSTTADGLLGIANRYDASRPEAQQHLPLPPSPSRFVPGQWPVESQLLATSRDDPPACSGSSFFTTIGILAATVTNITNLFSLPVRAAQRYLRKQNILAVPVVRQDGSNKKRLIDAGLADEPATPSPSARARANLLRRHLRPASTFLPDIWSPSPSPVQYLDNVQATLPTFYDSDDDDDSLQISFTDVFTSTSPHSSQTGSPVPLSWDSPQIVSSPGSPSLSPSPHRLTGSSRARHDPGPVTPMRRHLLKMQLRAQNGIQEAQAEGIIEPEAWRPKSETAVYEDSDLPIPSSPFQSDVSSSPFQPDVSSSPLELDVESSSVQPQVSSDLPPVYENDLSFLSDAPSPSPRKSVRWAQHAGTKSFFIDDRISEMLDSTLESITSSPGKGTWPAYDETVATSDEGQNGSLGSESPEESPRDTQKDIVADLVDVLGAPKDTFDSPEDSLDESQISLELLEDLQQDIQKKLALAPPPPPPVKPLVLPLSSKELDVLDNVVTQSDNGRNSNMYVIPEKLYVRDFGTLLPERFNGDPKAWLNDNIVNEYLSILVAHKKKELGYEHKRGGPAPPIHAFSSFWYTTIKDRPKSVERWASRFQLGGKQYLDAHLILYPICDGGHWRLLAVNPQERVIEYLDSLGFSGQKYVVKLMEYLQKELGSAWVEEEWTVLNKQRSSRQLNGSDCGVFTILNALTLLRGEGAHRVVPSCGMTEARERIASTLLAGDATTELE